jgi:hypothetical protein
MGVCTKGILSKEITAREVFDVIVSKYDKDAQFDVGIDKFDNTECGRIYFKVGENQRSIFYCVTEDKEESTEYDGVSHTILSLGSWDDSIEIMSNIIKVFGGYIDENDCDDIGYFHVDKDENFEYEEYVKQRKSIENVLDEKLSNSEKIMIATQILKCKEQLKEIL